MRFVRSAHSSACFVVLPAAGRPLSVPPNCTAASPSPAASLPRWLAGRSWGPRALLARPATGLRPVDTCEERAALRAAKRGGVTAEPASDSEEPSTLPTGRGGVGSTRRRSAWRPVRIAGRFSGSRGSDAPSADSKGEVARRQTRLAVLGRSPRASGGSLRAARETRSAAGSQRSRERRSRELIRTRRVLMTPPTPATVEDLRFSSQSEPTALATVEGFEGQRFGIESSD